VSEALRDVRARIDALARLAPAAAAAAAPAQAAGELQAHYTGVALLLSERLADVAQRFDRERALRTRLALAAAAARRSRAPAPSREAAPRARATQAGEGGGGGGGGGQVHSQQALAESRALAEELHRFVDDVRAAEGSMVQVAALSQTFSAHVAAQAEQIEALCVFFVMRARDAHNSRAQVLHGAGGEPQLCEGQCGAGENSGEVGRRAAGGGRYSAARVFSAALAGLAQRLGSLV